MGIQEKLEADLKEGMRSHNKARVQCIRQVRAKLQEQQNQPGFQGPINDALLAQIIGQYVKQLEKSCQEMAGGSGRASEIIAQYRAEVDYLAQFLPKRLPDDAVRAFLRNFLTEQGALPASQGGRLLGALLKAHPGEVDVARAKDLVAEVLMAQPSAEARS